MSANHANDVCLPMLWCQLPSTDGALNRCSEQHQHDLNIEAVVILAFLACPIVPLVCVTVPRCRALWVAVTHAKIIAICFSLFVAGVGEDRNVGGRKHQTS